MYKTSQPKIHLSRISGYDKKTYIISEDHIFDSEKDLISFLAKNHVPVLNFNGQPIPNTFKNDFLEDQALCGYSRKGYWDNIENNISCGKNMDEDWKLNSYLFWLDAPGQPNLDVRNLKKDIEKEGKWKICSYKQLYEAITISKNKKNDVEEPYHRALIEDYCLFIQSLHTLAQSWKVNEGDTFLLAKTNKEYCNELRIGDLQDKIWYSQLCVKLNQHLNDLLKVPN